MGQDIAARETATRADADAVRALQAAGRPLRGVEDLETVLERIGDARYVLIGEASHGTSEYYTWRARLTKRLIEERGFSFVGVEGDWPDCYRLNRYVKGRPNAGASAREVLQGFDRWPTWMWANWEVAAFAEWLRGRNAVSHEVPPVGFYGLDVYSLWESLEEVIAYLDRVDPEAAQTAREAYACFEPYGEDAQTYAWNTSLVPESCEDEVVELLLEMRRKAQRYDHDRDEAFSAEQNARVLVHAERYYRAMIGRGPESWNIRDRHMVATLEELMDHYGDGAKGIVWAHNTHVGDARATDMAGAGMVNVGQLVRERHADEGVVAVGFGCHRGSVIAGAAWGAPMDRMALPESRAGSWDQLMRRAGPGDRVFRMQSGPGNEALGQVRGHRAIGVVYHPERESGNYVPTRLSERYDAFLYFDWTEALHPLHVEADPSAGPPETYPWGL